MEYNENCWVVEVYYFLYQSVKNLIMHFFMLLFQTFIRITTNIYLDPLSLNLYILGGFSKFSLKPPQVSIFLKVSL